MGLGIRVRNKVRIRFRIRIRVSVRATNLLIHALMHCGTSRVIFRSLLGPNPHENKPIYRLITFLQSGSGLRVRVIARVRDLLSDVQHLILTTEAGCTVYRSVFGSALSASDRLYASQSSATHVALTFESITLE